MKTIAILNGYKMILPHYGKYDSVYGMFTTEGFIVALSDIQDIRLWKRIEYDYIILTSEEKLEEIYKNLINDEY
jgi:hypothetical protein